MYSFSVEEFLRISEPRPSDYVLRNDDSLSTINEIDSQSNKRDQPVNQSKNKNEENSDFCTNENEDEENDENNLDELINEIYLSIYWLNNKLGASYYDSEKQIIYYIEDIEESSNFEIIKILLDDLKPYKLLISAKMDEKLIDYLKISNENKLVSLPNNDFNYEHSKNRIYEVKLKQLEDLHITDSNECVIYYNTLLNFESKLMIRSIGALLKYLEKNRINVQLEDMSVKTPIHTMKSMVIDNLLLIDDNALQSLQIFHKVIHPSVYKQSTAREGFSLFGLYRNKVESKQGLAKLKSSFLKPTRNLNELNKRHEIIDFFLQSSHQDVQLQIRKCIKNIKNMSCLFKRMKSSQLNVTDWNSLYKTSENLVKFIGICESIVNNRHLKSITVLSRSSTIFSSNSTKSVHSNNNKLETNYILFENIIKENKENLRNLNRILDLLNKIIDYKKMNEKKKFTVKENIDTELDNKRQFYSNLAEFLTKLASTEMNKLVNITEFNILYIPYLGFLIQVPCDANNNNSDNQTEIEFTNKLKLVFNSDNKNYYKNDLMDKLDSKYGDLVTEMNRIENRIMNELQSLLSEYSYIYSQLDDYVSEIDICLAYSKVAKEYNYVKPQFHKNRELSFIYAEKCRHPLMELITNPFVPNDVHSGDVPSDVSFSPKLKLITGLNASGKTIYMKQVGLLVYMAFIGSYVPAQYAYIGDIDRIYTRLNSNNSVSLAMSTFQIDVKQVSEALHNYTSKTLILVDEFGKGTEVNDGKILFASLVRYFLLNNDGYDSIPHCLISTHFHEVIRQNFYFNDNDEIPDKEKFIEYLTFAYMVENDDKNEDINLVYLYNLVKNEITQSSYAIYIARKAGLNSEIIDRANQIVDAQANNQPVSALRTEKSSSEFLRCKLFVQEFLELSTEYEDSDLPIKEKASIFREFLSRLKADDDRATGVNKNELNATKTTTNESANSSKESQDSEKQYTKTSFCETETVEPKENNKDNYTSFKDIE